MASNVSFHGAAEINAVLLKDMAAKLEGARRTVSEVTDVIVAAAQAAAPSRSGRLRAGIHSTPPVPSGAFGWSGQATSDAPYSKFVDNGTRFMPARRFMTPADDAGAAAMPEILAKNMRTP